ncbi:protein phosphatase 2C domain-containing protein, partial [Streptomyces sp. URMC 124]|uniref:protein phosphatase 2C domain-containing protein n=1 Tax=Streptomyces sp. URMC 124 TaxID=3423405 RepID=UPI003F1DE030
AVGQGPGRPGRSPRPARTSRTPRADRPDTPAAPEPADRTEYAAGSDDPDAPEQGEHPAAPEPADRFDDGPTQGRSNRSPQVGPGADRADAPDAADHGDRSADGPARSRANRSPQASAYEGADRIDASEALDPDGRPVGGAAQGRSDRSPQVGLYEGADSADASEALDPDGRPVGGPAQGRSNRSTQLNPYEDADRADASAAPDHDDRSVGGASRGRLQRSGYPDAPEPADRPGGGASPRRSQRPAQPGPSEAEGEFGYPEVAESADRHGDGEGGDGRPLPARRADRAERTERPGPLDGPGGTDDPAQPQAPSRRELQGGYERADGPEASGRLKRTGRLERSARPVRAERPARPPRRALPEPSAPQPPPETPALPEPYEYPEYSGIPAQQRPELPESPAVPARRVPGASPARITGRAAEPAVREPGGGEPAEPAAGAASLEPASRPPVVSRESTPPRRHPPAAPPQPPRRAACGAEYVGERPPTYDAEPTAWPPADPQDLDGLVPDTVLDGAQYGAVTLRAVSLRGDSARYRGEPRRDALLTARFGEGEGALLLVAMASGPRGSDVAPRAARDACAWLAGAVGRSHARLADDIRGGRRGELKSGLHRLTDRSYGRLRARAAELGLRPDAYTATVRCLLLTADPQCRTRVFFGVGTGGLFRLREGVWQDLEPDPPAERTGEPVIGYGSPPADMMTMDLGIPTPGLAPPVEPAEVETPGEPFRFRASVARPGDTLMLCTSGLADPMRGEAELGGRLAERWAGEQPPGLAAFLADTQLRVKGYADDRTACALWEA